MSAFGTTEPTGRREGVELEVFSACPASVGELGRSYLDTVENVARWSERHGCRGILVYSDNRLVDPWLVSQVVAQSTSTLAPLVAVQPLYQHPRATARMIATFSALHERALYINWVAGGFKNDLLAMGDDLEHDARYRRLVEHAEIVRALTDGETVSYEGAFYHVKGLTLRPEMDPARRPGFMLSGSSPAGRDAGRRLGARSISYALPPDELDSDPAAHEPSGLRVGVIARAEASEAWRIAYERFPPDREGKLMRELANKVSDSHWHEKLSRLASERAEAGTPYWMGPFEHYKTMCPYLVGSHDEVASILGTYVERGVKTFVLDEPVEEADLKHARIAFDRATQTEVVTT